MSRMGWDETRTAASEYNHPHGLHGPGGARTSGSGSLNGFIPEKESFPINTSPWPWAAHSTRASSAPSLIQYWAALA